MLEAGPIQRAENVISRPDMPDSRYADIPVWSSPTRCNASRTGSPA